MKLLSNEDQLNILIKNMNGEMEQLRGHISRLQAENEKLAYDNDSLLDHTESLATVNRRLRADIDGQVAWC